MTKTLIPAVLCAGVLAVTASALAKLPPPPPQTDAQKQAAAEKKAQDAEKAKAELAAAEEATVKNYQANMKQEGKPIPKPVPVAATSTPATGAKPKPQGNTAKQGREANTNAASGGTQK